MITLRIKAIAALLEAGFSVEEVSTLFGDKTPETVTPIQKEFITQLRTPSPPYPHPPYPPYFLAPQILPVNPEWSKVT